MRSSSVTLLGSFDRKNYNTEGFRRCKREGRQQIMNKLVKDALVLTAITVIAGVCLGGVYEITKKPIADAQEVSNTGILQSSICRCSIFCRFRRI